MVLEDEVLDVLECLCLDLLGVGEIDIGNGSRLLVIPLITEIYVIPSSFKLVVVIDGVHDVGLVLDSIVS